MTVAQLKAALERFADDVDVRVHLSDVDDRTGVDAMADCEPLEILRVIDDPDTDGPLLVTENV